MDKIWQNPKLLRPPLLPPPPENHYMPPSSPAFIKLSRRQLTISTTKSSLLLLFTSQFQHHFGLFNPTPPPAAAATEEETINEEKPVGTDDETTTTVVEEKPAETNTVVDETIQEKPVGADDVTTTVVEEKPAETNTVVDETKQENPVGTDDVTTTTASATDGCANKVVTKRAFLDISIDGQPIGRIVVGLYGNNVPAGTARFGDFVSGAAGVSYRRKEFVKITPGYVQHGGVRSYGVDAELAAKTGRSLAADNLIDEWGRQNEKCPGTKNVARSIGIVVRDPLKPPPKQKLVARKGKLEIDEEEVGKDPNGTEFVISTKDSPELDASTLVVGEVLQGMEVVQRIGQVKTVQENTSSPYFRVAKLIGDKRAVVAERGFNRPYSKVVVTNCGLMA